MGDVVEFRRRGGRGADSTAYRLLKRTPIAGAYRPPDAECSECDGVGWFKRGVGVDRVVICDCMRAQA